MEKQSTERVACRKLVLMNKFKVGDIVLAIADNTEFVDDEKGKVFAVTRFYNSKLSKDIYDTIDIKSLWCEEKIKCYYTYKFKKINKYQIEKYKFKYIVNKLKGVHVNE